MPMSVSTVPTASVTVLPTTTQNIALISANHAIDSDPRELRHVGGTAWREKSSAAACRGPRIVCDDRAGICSHSTRRDLALPS